MAGQAELVPDSGRKHPHLAQEELCQMATMTEGVWKAGVVLATLV